MRELLHKLCEEFLEQNVVTSYNWDMKSVITVAKPISASWNTVSFPSSCAADT